MLVEQRKMIKIAGLAGLMIVLSVLQACSSTEPLETNAPTKAQEFSKLGIVTSGGNNLDLTTNTRFAWREPMQVLGVKDSQKGVIAKQLMTSVTNVLLVKGFKFNGLKDADYLISAVGVLGDVPMNSTYTLDPGLVPTSTELETGTLSIVIRNANGHIEWRGSAQVITSDELSEEFRSRRRRKAIESLLERIEPASY